MSFTKRDYEAIARIIHNELARPCTNPGYHALATDAARRIKRELSAHFAATNPAFDPERFAKACEPGGGK